MSAGSILRLLRPDEVPATMQWFGWGGLALAFAAYTISNMTPSIYSNSDFWLNSPALIFIKLGAVLILMAFAWVWNLRVAATDWSWVRQFGMTSLLVYWVHVELVYGRWFGSLKGHLSVGRTVFASILTIVLMLVLSLIRTNWAAVKVYFTSPDRSLADRVSGD